MKLEKAINFIIDSKKIYQDTEEFYRVHNLWDKFQEYIEGIFFMLDIDRDIEKIIGKPLKEWNGEKLFEIFDYGYQKHELNEMPLFEEFMKSQSIWVTYFLNERDGSLVITSAFTINAQHIALSFAESCEEYYDTVTEEDRQKRWQYARELIQEEIDVIDKEGIEYLNIL